MKTLLIISILNLGFSCSNKPKETVKTINNDSQLTQMVDSLESSNKKIIPQKEKYTAKTDSIIQENVQYEDYIEDAVSKMFKEKKARKSFFYLSEDLNSRVFFENFHNLFNRFFIIFLFIKIMPNCKACNNYKYNIKYNSSFHIIFL